MKNRIVKLGKDIITNLVVKTSIDSANTTCFFLCNQPKLPEVVKKLKKK